MSYNKSIALDKEGLKSDLNWCLYLSNNGDSGIFFSELEPGIADCRGGILYIAPKDSMPNVSLNSLTAYSAKIHILKYYFEP